MFNLLKSFQSKSDVVVLMYHRVTDLAIDPWQLAVTPEQFEGQLKLLNKKYRVVSVEELLHHYHRGKIKSKTVCLTFDDGYLDNYLEAKPLLEKYNCAATFFIATYYIKAQIGFWWDELLKLIMFSPELPKDITIHVHQNKFHRRIKEQRINVEKNQELKYWVWNQAYPTERCEIYMALWAFLQPLPIHEILICLAQLTDLINQPAKLLQDERAMTHAQLKNLAANPLFQAGIHTITHPALACHSKFEQEQELLKCKVELETLLNQNINIAAYPYGNFNDDTLQVMKENQISAGFTTKAQTVNCDSNIHQLGRFHVTNQNQSEFEQQLKLWFK